jgi:hypothetical protein
VREPGQESRPARGTYSPADAAADLAFYRQLKRRSAIGTFGIVVLCTPALAVWNGWWALCIATGGLAGVLNLLLSMRGNEKLLDRGSVAPFVISSFVRIALFGIVPVVLAVRSPSLWTLGWYFIGFFTPLALSGILTILRER